MNYEELSNLSDESLLKRAKKMKSMAILHALLIGFMIGIIIYSIYNKSYSLFTLIPIYFVSRAVKRGKNDEALKKVLKERNLKL